MLIIFIISKQVMIADFNYKYHVEILQLIFLLVALGITVDRSFIKGLLLAISPVLFLDIIVNISETLFDISLLSVSSTSERSDGARAKGVYGNSFYSLCLLLSFIFILIALRKRKLGYLAQSLLLFSGTLRALIIGVLINSGRFYSKNLFLFIVLVASISGLIITGTVISTSANFLGETSGNYFRMIAWTNAITDISDSPIWGLREPLPRAETAFAINISNILYYKIYESRFLSDFAKYGVFFIILKCGFYMLIVREVFTRILKKQFDNYKSVILAYYFIVDYLFFSLLGMPFLLMIYSLVFLSMKGRRNGI